MARGEDDPYRERDKTHDKKHGKDDQERKRKMYRNSEDTDRKESKRERDREMDRYHSRYRVKYTEEKEKLIRRQISEDTDGKQRKHERYRDTRRRSRESHHSSSRSPSRNSRTESRTSRNRNHKRRRYDSEERKRDSKRDHSINKDTKEKEWKKEHKTFVYASKAEETKFSEKDSAYQDRLSNWGARERRKMKEYEKEKSEMEDQKREDSERARRIKEFMENYDDLRDDKEHYKGSAFISKMKKRLKEIKRDNEDRKREEEELQDAQEKLPDQVTLSPEIHGNTLPKEENNFADAFGSEQPVCVKEEKKLSSPSSRMKGDTKSRSRQGTGDGFKNAKQQPLVNGNMQNAFSVNDAPQEKITLTPCSNLRVTAKTSNSRTFNNAHAPHKRKLTASEVFGTSDEEEARQNKKWKPMPLDDAQEERVKNEVKSVSHMTSEQKKKLVKDLIDKIPAAKEELFSYNVDWKMVDNSLMAKRIRPYIKDKIVVYVGEEMPPLVEYICSKVKSACGPQIIVDELSFILDEEAQVFVMKIWRLLFYEIEARKLGLEKSYQQRT